MDNDNTFTKMNNFSTTSVKFLELAFIFIIIFSVVCKVANYEFVHSKILNKIYSFIINRLVSINLFMILKIRISYFLYL